MSGLWNWLKRILGFGDEEKPVPTPTPTPEPTPVPIDPHEPPDNPPVPDPLPDPPLTSAKPDRLFVNGEEVDSHVDPVQNVIVKTILKKLTMKKGQAGMLNLVVTAEPLADPADRAKLKFELGRPGPHTLFLGAHSLHLSDAAYTAGILLMSKPTWKLIGEGIQVREETSSPGFRTIKLFFYGDEPMRVEIDVPFNVKVGDIPDWAYTAFRFDYTARRFPGATANEPEHADKEVVIA